MAIRPGPTERPSVATQAPTSTVDQQAPAGARHLRLVGLTKAFGTTVAVDHIDLDVPPGEVLALLGPSGCGKTTTLNMVAGFLDPDAGDILVGERSVVDLAAHRRNIGIVFQSYAIFPHLDVADNVAFGLRWRKVPKKHRRQRAEAQLARVGLAGLGDRFPSQLSGGQRQRVALARALIIEPELLLLDEPLSNLDAQLRSEMRSEIRSLVERAGVTTIIVTHDQEEALSMSDRVAVMRDGLIEQLGPPDELFDTPASRFVAEFVGRSMRLPGDLAGVADGIASVRLPDGQLAAGRWRSAAAPSVGTAACVIVRPGSIRIEREPVVGEGLAVELERSALVGDELELTFRSSHPLVLRASRRDGLAPGDRCRLVWRPEEAHVFALDA